MKIILSVIAVCLVMITVKLYEPYDLDGIGMVWVLYLVPTISLGLSIWGNWEEETPDTLTERIVFWGAPFVALFVILNTLSVLIVCVGWLLYQLISWIF